MIAAKHGCIGLGYARALYVTTKRELVTTVRTHTGLTRETVESIIDTLTFGRHDQRNPDPALQPLIPLTSRHLVLAPNLILNSALERNLAVLLNRLPEEKALYAALSKAREAISKQRVTRTLDVHMSRLRKKLPPLRGMLRAVKHLGYKLDPPNSVLVDRRARDLA